MFVVDSGRFFLSELFDIKPTKYIVKHVRIN